MGRGLSDLQRRVLSWIAENPPADNGARDYNWDRHPDFGASFPAALSRALRNLERRGLVLRSWSDPSAKGHTRVELTPDGARTWRVGP